MLEVEHLVARSVATIGCCEGLSDTFRMNVRLTLQADRHIALCARTV